jgi:hypothetical protein
MKTWQKAVIIGVAIGGGAVIGVAFYKRQQNLGLFAQFRRHGDINGDGVIDDKDSALMQAAWGSKPGDSNWNPDADLNSDGIVNILDANILGYNYGLTYSQWLKTLGYAKKYAGQTNIVPIKEI